MPLIDFERRVPDNVPGRYYVGNQCMDCNLCREVAPTVFGRNDVSGSSFVKKQPATADETKRADEAVRCCCVETIHRDGESFDWAAIPARPELNYPSALNDAPNQSKDMTP